MTLGERHKRMGDEITSFSGLVHRIPKHAWVRVYQRSGGESDSVLLEERRVAIPQAGVVVRWDPSPREAAGFSLDPHTSGLTRSRSSAGE